LTNIRRAEISDAETLTGLALRAKAHWGYDAEFIEDCHTELTIRAENLRAFTVKVAEREGEPVGFYSLEPHGDQVELVHLFVEPEMIGSGIGKLLWNDAVATARAAAFTTILITSDPYAEGFYLAMGAERVGTIESTVRAGRELPLLRFGLA
jgi:N-acetylglutamate synthase-like GNAT family acetyltransferase